MKKIIFITTIFSTLLYSCIGTFAINANAKTLDNKTDMIYTSLPSKHDKYYKPIYRNLINYNSDLNQHKDINGFRCISKEKEPFPTSNYTYDDIWVRDVAPIITTKMVKFRYQPSYLTKSTGNYLNNSFLNWLNKNRFNYQTSNLKLDGGNCQWNGNDAVVITNKILKDNPNYSKIQITNEIKNKLDVKKVIIIPAEPGDVLGHADGMIKFIKPNVAFISDFEGNKSFYNKVVKKLKEQIPNLKLITLKSAYTDKGQADPKIASAKGLYINMLETPTTIYVPTFGLKTDDSTIKIIQSYTNKKVIPISVSKISTYGGALHCTTWNVPNKFLPKK